MFLKILKNISFIFIISSCAIPYNYEYVNDTFNGKPIDSDSSTDDDLSALVCNSDTEIYDKEANCCICKNAMIRVEGECVYPLNPDGTIPPTNGQCPENTTISPDGSICVPDQTTITCTNGYTPIGENCVCLTNYLVNGVCTELPEISGWEPIPLPPGPSFGNNIEIKNIKIFQENSLINYCFSSIEDNHIYKAICKNQDGNPIKTSNFVLDEPDNSTFLDTYFDFKDNLFKVAFLYNIANELNYYFKENIQGEPDVSIGPSLPINSLNYNPDFNYKLKRDIAFNFEQLNQQNFSIEQSKQGTNIINLLNIESSNLENINIDTQFSKLDSQTYEEFYFYNYFNQESLEYQFFKYDNFLNPPQTLSLNGYFPVGTFRKTEDQDVLIKTLNIDAGLLKISENTVLDVLANSIIFKITNTDITDVNILNKVLYDSYLYDSNNKVLKVALIISENHSYLYFLDGNQGDIQGNEIEIGSLFEYQNIDKNNLKVKLKIIDENKFIIIFKTTNNSIRKVVFNKK